MISDVTIGEIIARANTRECVFWGWQNTKFSELKIKGIDIKKVFTGNNKLLNESEQFIDCKLLKGNSCKYFVIFPFWFKEKKTQEFYLKKLKEYGYTDGDWLTLAPKCVQNIGKNEGYIDTYGNTSSKIPGGGLNK